MRCFVRYVLNAPTSWSLDVSFIMYGTLFMMGGAYTLSRGGHVRGDFIYRLWSARTQAEVDLVLYLFFFFPGVTALILTGLEICLARSWGYGEVSVNSPAGVPIFQFKSVMVAAGLLAVHPGSWRRSAAASCACAKATGAGPTRTSRKPRSCWPNRPIPMAPEPVQARRAEEAP